MSESDKFHLRRKSDTEFVDIHGRDIPAVKINGSKEIAFYLTDLKQTGVGIFKKSQYDKLSTVNKEFDEDFNLFMLEAAKKYMLENKIAFKENEILNTINSCKKKLTEARKTSPTKIFFKDRLVEEFSDNEIHIRVNVSPSSCPPTTSSVSGKVASPRQFSKASKTLGFKESENSNIHLNRKQNNAVQDSNQNHDKSDPNQPRGSKLRFTKSDFIEKIPLGEIGQKECKVIVTCIHKRNCIWARDTANDDLFNKIHRLVNQEAKYQKLAPKPLHLEKVYLAQDEGFWFRCKVVRFTPLTVFFLDYGNMAEVNELREVSEELAKVPCMAVRLTFKESEYDPRLEDEITIKIIKQNVDSTYFVNVLNQTKKAEVGLQHFFKIPPPLTSIKNGQTVVVIHVENGLLYLRTKECFLKLKEIEKGIESYIGSARPLRALRVEQLVLTREEDDGKYYRGVVTVVKQKTVDIKYLDYHKCTTVDKDSLKNINSVLSAEPTTYFPALKLKGFESRDFSDEDKVFIQEIISKRKKWSVVLDDKGGFDLSDGSTLISQQLEQLKQAPKKIYLQDMKTYIPDFCINSYLCGFYKSSNEFCLVPSAALETHINSVLITDVQDPDPYTPIAGEVCFCDYTDQWYRCLVTRVLNNDFEVVLLDFGNVEIVKKANLRKGDDQITQVPILALPCKLINLPNHPNVEEILKKLIIEGELYNADIKSINDGKYSVEIPSVYQQIMKS